MALAPGAAATATPSRSIMVIGLETLYAHCSAICVTPGQQVQKSEVIGFVGSTGNSTGDHLCFEVWVNGERTDAMSFFGYANYTGNIIHI